MKRTPVVLFTFGQGGHSTAMRRLRQHLDLQSVPEIQLMESKSVPIPGVKAYVVPRIMPKERIEVLNIVVVPAMILANIAIIVYIFIRYRIRIIVTTGPLIAVLPAILGRCLGIETIFLESWCRFESFSRTGRILNVIGASIYYQNFEIATKMPQAKYSGRL